VKYLKIRIISAAAGYEIKNRSYLLSVDQCLHPALGVFAIWSPRSLANELRTGDNSEFRDTIPLLLLRSLSSAPAGGE
jgi:hypothetical protein